MKGTKSSGILCLVASFALLGAAVAAKGASPDPGPPGPAPRIGASQNVASQGDRAYDNGYDAGYKLGQADRNAGRRSDFSRSTIYRRATAGWEASLGDRQQYRESFRGGFRDGYQDGYNEAGATTQAVPPPPPRVAPARAAADDAFANGYREGYTHGRRDRGGNYDASHSAIYQEARRGYDAGRFPSLEDYQFNFRQGYEAGYDDAYHGRDSDPRREKLRTYSSRRASASASAPAVINVPEGTVLHLRLNNTISTRSSRQGDRFTASVTEPVYQQSSSEVAIPVGSTVTGLVANVERPGRVSGVAELHLRYESLILPEGAEYQLNATTSGVGSGEVKGVDKDEGTVEGKKSTGRDVGTVAAGGALGAIIGGIAGGGKGAGIGAAIGSAVGLGGVLSTRGHEIDLNNGTNMEIRLERPLELRR